MIHSRWSISFVRLLALVAGTTVLLLWQCNRIEPVEDPEKRMARVLVQEWNRMALELERFTPGYRPPVSARMFAYLGMTAYEAALPSLPDYLSLENHCQGYKTPEGPGDRYVLTAGLNAAYATSLRRFFPEAPFAMRAKLDALEAAWVKRTQGDPEVLEASSAFGRRVADAVWQWSATDAIGHDAYLYNFDRTYVPPVGEGKWKPNQNHTMPALLPNWYHVRQFSTDTVRVAPPLPYDTLPGSPYHTEALEVFTVSRNLSKENRWIAEFWSDDVEGLTLTPSGRWIMIANQALDQAEVSFETALETYLLVGWALNDAAVTCWTGKYRYNVQRPEDYIRKHVDPSWKPLHDSPSFPAYPSGHATFGAAAAEVLSDQLGHEFQLTDRTHDNRIEFAGMPRTYANFREMATENAASRLYLGVHFRMDCTEGLRIGRTIGKNIVSLKLKRNGLAVTS